MTRRTKWIIWVLGGICAFVAAGWAFWLPLWTSLVVRHGADFFRDNFQPSRELHAAIHEDTWATWYFAGTKGLPVIMTLSQDASLIPSGRSTASNLLIHISTGRHLPAVRWALAEGHLPWVGRQYYGYLLKRDTDFLMRKGLPIPQGTQL